MKMRFCGIELQSPLILGSGPLSYGAEGMIAAHKAHAGAVVTKTIRDEAALNPINHMALNTPTSMVNCEKWSDYEPQRWIDREIPLAKQAGVTVIASIGHTPQEAARWIPGVIEAGCDMIELVSYEQETIIPMLDVARKLTDRPVIVKLSPNWPDPLSCAIEAEAHGADAITAMDSLGPVLRIDITSATPLLGGKNGQGWLTGSAIRPLIIRHVAEISQTVSIPVIGLGGVMKAEDGIEMLLAGASAIGVCSACILKGIGYLETLERKVDELVSSLGYGRYEKVIGAALKNLQNQEQLGELQFEFTPERCTACNRCVLVCPYDSRSLENGKMGLDRKTCRSCGLCASVCPTAALRIT